MTQGTRFNFAGVGVLAALPASTGTLNLVRATRALAKAEATDRESFAELLDAEVPGNWPPEIVTGPGQDEEEWHSCYLTIRSEFGQRRTAVGVAGIRVSGVTAQIGCSFLPEFQGRRLGREIVESLGRWAVAQNDINHAICDIRNGHLQAQECLRSAGYFPSSEDAPPGFIRFELRRAGKTA